MTGLARLVNYIIALLGDPKQFALLLRRLHRNNWVVYAKPAMGGHSQVLRYLGRYTHRVAISITVWCPSMASASEPDTDEGGEHNAGTVSQRRHRVRTAGPRIGGNGRIT
jgi:hypothetical protein